MLYSTIYGAKIWPRYSSALGVKFVMWHEIHKPKTKEGCLLSTVEEFLYG